jgi:uncharacterized protein involved in outer membrane biogenesis
MKKNIFRILLMLLALIAAAVILPVVAFHLVFPQSRLHDMFVNGLRGALSRDVTAGRISLGWKTASVTDLAISDFPDFRAGTFLTARRVSVSFSFTGLRHGQPVTGMRLEAPHLAVTKRADGTTSFDRLVGPGQHSRLSFFLMTRRFEIRDGSLAFRDAARKNSGVDIRHIDGSVDVESFTAPVRIRLAGAAEAQGMPPLPVAFDGSLALLDNKLTIDRLALGEGSPLTIAGTVEGLGRSGNRFELSVTGARAALERVTAFLSLPPGLQLGEGDRIDLTVSGVSGRLRIRDNTRRSR